MKRTIEIYTDGSCKDNPGKGGYAYIYGSNHVSTNGSGSGGYKRTTNNRMELMAILKGLEEVFGRVTEVLASDTLEKMNLEKWIDEVHVFSDSQYSINIFNRRWYVRWKRNNWINNNKSVPNRDLIESLVDIIDLYKSKSITIRFNYVRGHSGHPLNEKVDKMARMESSKEEKDLKTDTIYEAQRGVRNGR